MVFVENFFREGKEEQYIEVSRPVVDYIEQMSDEGSHFRYEVLLSLNNKISDGSRKKYTSPFLT